MQELLHTLGVDVPTLIAQLINFTLLFVVLTYFVYKPVLKVLDERRDRIAHSMEEAKRIEHQAQEMEQARIGQLRKIDEEAGKFLETAKKQAEEAKAKILGGAQEEVDQLLAKGKKQLEDERAKLMGEMQETLARLSLKMAEKVLRKEFTEQDQDRLVKSLEKDLPSLLS